MNPTPLWSILFFLMIFMLGIDSQFTMVETLVTTINDEFNFYVKKYLKRKEFLVLIVCVFTFFLCIPNLCPVRDFIIIFNTLFYFIFCLTRVAFIISH
jgi:solute carrier family 6 (neurotransmitter transporter, taurine) member 6